MSGWTSTLSGKAPLSRGNGPGACPDKPRAALPRVGKKGALWAAAWREMKPRFERAGITRCEIGFEGCLGGMYLTPMHSLKRRNITTPEKLREIVIACVHCHAIGEMKPESEMERLVIAVIDHRENPV